MYLLEWWNLATSVHEAYWQESTVIVATLSFVCILVLIHFILDGFIVNSDFILLYILIFFPRINIDSDVWAGASTYYLDIPFQPSVTFHIETNNLFWLLYETGYWGETGCAGQVADRRV